MSNITASAVRRALKSLPKILDDTYVRILCNIDEDYLQMTIAALKWLPFSERPLTVQELAEASVINPDSQTIFDEDDRLRGPHDIFQVLSRLVTTSNEIISERSDYREGEIVEMIRLAHFSVKEYLISDRILLGPASLFATADGLASIPRIDDGLV